MALKASEEMNATIPVLLELSRRPEKIVMDQDLDIQKVVMDVIRELSELFSVDTRISLECESECLIKADKVLAKMLIRNLIQNALQHTSGKIHLSLSASSLRIFDQGSEAESQHFQKLERNASNQNSNFTSG